MTVIPKSIRIGPYTYTLKVDQKYIDSIIKDDDGSSIAGYTEFLKQRITISNAPGKDFRRDTVLHEVLHCCLKTVGFDIEIEAKEGRYDNLEERLVSPRATILLDTLKRNPELVKYLLDE